MSWVKRSQDENIVGKLNHAQRAIMIFCVVRKQDALLRGSCRAYFRNKIVSFDARDNLDVALKDLQIREGLVRHTNLCSGH